MKQSKFAGIPFSASKSPFYYGWVIIVVGTLGLLMTIPGQTIGLSTFTDSLIDALSISRDQLSLAYMCGTIASSLLLIKAFEYLKFSNEAISLKYIPNKFGPILLGPSFLKE